MTKPQTIRNLIELSGCKTQKEFALKHGKQPNQVSEWLTNKRHISYAILQEIANKEGYLLTIEFKLEKL